MPNLVGIGNSQVPTNAMLGGLAYQDSVGEITIDKIKAKILDTSNGTNIFVYDTSKDSDGGAWRKKATTQSWYNEGVSATRGARKEFPAVAVIVAERNFITIYDGDDPNLSMWMVFNTIAGGNSQGMGFPSQGAGRPMVQLQGVDKVVHMLNGILVTGTKNEGSNYGQPVINFINEKVLRMDSQTGEGGEWIGNIAQRNEALGYRSVDHDYVIKASHVNDVAMTVLPNAPIDETTGLPIPTIAVATPDGVSIIKDDGTVVDIRGSHGGGENDTQFVNFDSKTNAVISGFDYGGGNTDAIYKLHVFPIPETDITENTFYNGYQNHHRRVQTGTNVTVPKLEGNYIRDAISAGGNGRYAIRTGNSPSTGYPTALNIMQEEPGTDGSNTNFPSNSRIAYITKDYNTGWMHGDIKGAFLSSTDTTSLSADTLKPADTTLDSTFATSTGWIADADWTISGGVATCDGQNNGRFLYPNAMSYPIGASVVVEVTVTAYTSGTLSISYDTGNATSGTNMTGTGDYKFVGQNSGNNMIYLRSDSFIGSIDNVKIYIADHDRSVNKNGLIPYGTITRTPVATGAELVAYGGFSVSNYLEQPYNSDLNFGNNDFAVYGWFKLATNSLQTLMMLMEPTGQVDYMLVEQQANGDMRFQVDSQSGASVAYAETLPTGVWIHYCGVNIDNDKTYLYINGEPTGLNNGVTHGSSSFDNTTAKLTIGRRSTASYGNSDARPFGGEMALWRISTSVPSEEQIKKMYNDEKCLFHENAKCTLHGTADAITAIAYDDTNDILHAGTSSGRSEFQGLVRINNTTTAVTTSISASNGLVAEK